MVDKRDFYTVNSLKIKISRRTLVPLLSVYSNKYHKRVVEAKNLDRNYATENRETHGVSLDSAPAIVLQSQSIVSWKILDLAPVGMYCRERKEKEKKLCS